MSSFLSNFLQCITMLIMDRLDRFWIQAEHLRRSFGGFFCCLLVLQKLHYLKVISVCDSVWSACFTLTSAGEFSVNFMDKQKCPGYISNSLSIPYTQARLSAKFLRFYSISLSAKLLLSSFIPLSKFQREAFFVLILTSCFVLLWKSCF